MNSPVCPGCHTPAPGGTYPPSMDDADTPLPWWCFPCLNGQAKP